MVFFVWRGRGYFVILAIIISFIITAALESFLGFRDATVQTGILEFVIGILVFIPVWIYGKKWNVPLELINKKTGQEFTIKNPHTFFWIPMQYWAIIYPVLILVIFIVY
jgi:hypothetical protein